jgi:PAS domain S-box-containing protein
MRQTVLVMTIALAFGMGFWWLDSIYEYYMFSENLRFMLFQEPLNFLDSLVLNVPLHALINRLSFLVACLVGGALVSWALAKNRTSQARYRTYVRNAPSGIVVVDSRGCIREANRTWCRTLGYDGEELTGMSLEELASPEDRKEIQRRISALQNEARADGEIAFRSRDGQKIETSLSAVRIDSENLLLFLRDVTESRQLEERLRQSQKLESIGQLAGGIAHDFNNLLTGILGNAELLKLEESGNETVGKYAEEIMTSSRRGSDLTRKLLNFARREKFATIVVDVHKLMDEVVSLLRHSIDRRIEIQRDYQADTCLVQGDPSQLQNAILNLGLNARDALPEGGTVTLSTRNVDLDGQGHSTIGRDLKPGTYVEIDVSDDGVGMDEQTRRKIFDPFFTTKEVGRGTGLGLASVYGTVRSHQGAVSVYSQPGKGTTMKVYLPVSTEGPAEAPDPSWKMVRLKGRGRLLLVDDEDVVRRFASQSLESMGYTVETAADGASALKLASRCVYDLVLLDLIMPRMSGSEVLIRLKKQCPQTPVVITSGFSSNLAWDDLKKHGAAGFVPKPFGARELTEMLQKHLPGSLEDE